MFGSFVIATIAFLSLVNGIFDQCPVPNELQPFVQETSPVYFVQMNVNRYNRTPADKELSYDDRQHSNDAGEGLMDEVEVPNTFPSFEEWRKTNLEKSGQIDWDTDNRDESNSRSGSGSSPRHYDEDFFGDDNLEIDVSMFSPAMDLDAGRVYKERFNYASSDCAATVIKTNTKTKGASNILIENKDTYLLNECSEENKFVVIELCQDILVDTIAIANYEFFSSMFRHIRISVADRFPTSNWKVLGDFEGQSVRDLQHFQIKNPLIWAR